MNWSFVILVISLYGIGVCFGFIIKVFFILGRGRVELVLVWGMDWLVVNSGDIEEVTRLKEFGDEVVSGGMYVGSLFVFDVKLEIFV